MSLWTCQKCGEITGGSDGAPQCAGCGSLEVYRIQAMINPENMVTTESESLLVEYAQLKEENPSLRALLAEAGKMLAGVDACCIDDKPRRAALIAAICALMGIEVKK